MFTLIFLFYLSFINKIDVYTFKFIFIYYTWKIFVMQFDNNMW
jgi:hypothetical protein